MPTYHLLIKGKVQGVFYRANASKIAQQLGITGWVRNTEKNEVEMMAHGGEEQISTLIGWCRQGPSRAKVDEVIAERVADSDFKNFEILK